MTTEALELSITVADDGVTLATPERNFEGAPLRERELRELQRLREAVGPKEYGAALFDVLFGGQLHAGYLEALAPKESQARIRLEVSASAPALNAVWWEALTAKGPPPVFLGHSYRTPFSRRPAVRAPDLERVPITEEKLRVLVVISNPTDLEGLPWKLPRTDESAMLEAISEAMAPLSDRIEFEVQTTPASVGRIRERLSGEVFHVLHVFSYGGFEGPDDPCLLLENEDETAASVGRDELAELVMDLRDLRLVVLASCPTGSAAPDPQLGRPTGEAFGGLVPRMIEYGLPAVVSMQDCVDTDVAKLFTESFYRALGRSSSGRIDEVINSTRESIYYRRRATWDWAIPVLFMSGAGVLFEPLASEAPAESPPPAAHRQGIPQDRSIVAAQSSVTGGKRPTAPMHLGVTAGKPDQPGTQRYQRSVLIKELIDLDLTEEELRRMSRELLVDPVHIEASTPHQRCARLVDVAIEHGLVQALRGRTRAILKARNEAGLQAEIYDLADRRSLVRGVSS